MSTKDHKDGAEYPAVQEERLAHVLRKGCLQPLLGSALKKATHQRINNQRLCYSNRQSSGVAGPRLIRIDG